MATLELHIPKHHASEYRHLLSSAGLDFAVNDSFNSDRKIFEVYGSLQNVNHAKNLWEDLDTYSTVTYVLSKNLEHFLDRAARNGVSVVESRVSLHILDKPFLHRVEIKGREGNLTETLR